MVYRICRNILWTLCRLCFRCEIKYRENLPRKAPFIIASNHASFADPSVLSGITTEQIHFIARESLFTNWFTKWWSAAVGIIPIKMGRFDLSAIKGTLEHLAKGEIVALFPEGSRSNDGIIKEPKGGVGFVAAKAGVPVVPVFIKGTDKALPINANFIRFKKVMVMVGKPVEPKEFLDKKGNCDYQALSQEVMNRIANFSRDEPSPS